VVPIEVATTSPSTTVRLNRNGRLWFMDILLVPFRPLVAVSVAPTEAFLEGTGRPSGAHREASLDWRGPLPILAGEPEPYCLGARLASRGHAQLAKTAETGLSTVFGARKRRSAISAFVKAVRNQMHYGERRQRGAGGVRRPPCQCDTP
jgi:hypothetical protein